MKKTFSEAFKVAILAVIFLPTIAVLAQFLGLSDLAELAYVNSPALIFSDDQIDKAVWMAEERRNLRQTGQRLQEDGLRIIAHHGLDLTSWQKQFKNAHRVFTENLDSKPVIPVLEFRKMYGVEGSFENLLSIGIDPDGEDALRTMIHELSHVYLLWAFFLGMPIDCPRWLNEGMAESMADALIDGSPHRQAAEMTMEKSVVAFKDLSPAFSWNGYFVDLQAKHAFCFLLRKVGWDGIRRIIAGLKRARPFRSVFQVEFGYPVAKFEQECLDDFLQNRVISRLSKKNIEERLFKLVSYQSAVELIPLIREAEKLCLTASAAQHLMIVTKIREAKKCLARGNPCEAMGWLQNIQRTDNPQAAELVDEIHSEITHAAPNLQRIKARPLRRGMIGIVVSLLFGVVSIKLYRRFRACIKPWLCDAWYPGEMSNLWFRWSVVIFFSMGSAWFIRFLIVAFFPYAGIGGLSDYSRILLAELCVVLSWLGLAWQFEKWDLKISREKSQHPSSSDAGSSVALIAIAVIPPVYIASCNGWTQSGISLDETVTAALVLLANTAALGRLIWNMCGRWSRIFPLMNPLFPAFGYAIARVGFFIESPKFIFAFLLGFLLVKKANSSGNLLSCISTDYFCLLPNFVLIVSYFPAQDPLGGYFQMRQDSFPIWMTAIFALMFFLGGLRRQVSNSCSGTPETAGERVPR